jgi:hypothetical protein
MLLLQTKLSERNVVELVNKLKNLGLLGDDLLYTTNGKEYVTTERVQAEVRAAVRAAGGRVPLVRQAWGCSGGQPLPATDELALGASFDMGGTSVLLDVFSGRYPQPGLRLPCLPRPPAPTCITTLHPAVPPGGRPRSAGPRPVALRAGR